MEMASTEFGGKQGHEIGPRWLSGSDSCFTTENCLVPIQGSVLGAGCVGWLIDWLIELWLTLALDPLPSSAAASALALLSQLAAASAPVTGLLVGAGTGVGAGDGAGDLLLVVLALELGLELGCCKETSSVSLLLEYRIQSASSYQAILMV